MFVPDNAFYTIYPVDIKVTRIKRFLLKKKVFSKTCLLIYIIQYFIFPLPTLYKAIRVHIYIFLHEYILNIN